MSAAIRSPQPPLTRSVEDYLKSVFHLTSQGGFATTSDIAAMREPRYDPHGAPIPTAAGEIEEAELVTLAEADVGGSVILQEVDDEHPERLHYLAEQGLTPGVRLRVIERQPFNGPTIVRRDDGTTRVVGQELGLLLFCRPTDGE